MCGICGFSGIGSKMDLESMTDALLHRGPDAGGLFMDSHAALGHRRLSIVDLQCGAQPMRDEQSGAIIVYNGEIYNHWPIRLELEKLGHVFHTSHSDTETVLHAFAEWGPDCFLKFNGMFACAIYWPKENKIWLARDRFGEKPLFYTHNDEGFAFASEICSLKLWPGFEKAYDEANLQRFFSWNYLSGARSAHKNCRSLEAGQWLCYDLNTKTIARRRYWQFTLAPDDSLKEKHEAELVEELRGLLIQAVQRRFLSDVPLGIFLSGGIDSSAILAAACKGADPAGLRTFTIGFKEKSFDESDKARTVAEFLNVRNDVEYLTEADMRHSIPGILSRLSEPFGDASLIPTARLSQFAAKHVKVALSGDGGDELFGGYDPMDAVQPAEIYARIMPQKAHGLLRRLFERIPASDRNMSLEFKIKRFLRGLGYPPGMRIPVWMSGLEPAEIASFFHDPLSAAELYADALKLYASQQQLSPLEHALMFFSRLYLTDDILVKSDRASMMFSLETRAVFLDNDIVEFCMRLPMRFKYRRGQRKYLLKKALAGWLPRHILEQPKKGFGIPLNLWLRGLPEPDVHVPGMKPAAVKSCQKAHNKRLGDFRYFLWDMQAFAHLPQ